MSKVAAIGLGLASVVGIGALIWKVNTKEKKQIPPDVILGIIQADADYFHSMEFISESTYQAVISWLGGKEDSETQLIIADWLDSDALWFGKVEASLMKEYWYLWPATLIGFNHLKQLLEECVKYLRE